MLGYALLIPAIAIILTFKAYPFLLGIWFSLTDKLVGNPGEFIGLSNYLKIMKSQIFWQTAWNTVFFTTMATIFKTLLGMWLALILYRKFRFSRFTRAVILLPFSALPWLVAFTIRTARTRGWRYPALFALTVATCGSVNATALLLVGVGALRAMTFAVPAGDARTRSGRSRSARRKAGRSADGWTRRERRGSTASQVHAARAPHRRRARRRHCRDRGHRPRRARHEAGHHVLHREGR